MRSHESFDKCQCQTEMEIIDLKSSTQSPEGGTCWCAEQRTKFVQTWCVWQCNHWRSMGDIGLLQEALGKGPWLRFGPATLPLIWISRWDHLQKFRFPCDPIWTWSSYCGSSGGWHSNSETWFWCAPCHPTRPHLGFRGFTPSDWSNLLSNLSIYASFLPFFFILIMYIVIVRFGQDFLIAEWCSRLFKWAAMRWNCWEWPTLKLMLCWRPDVMKALKESTNITTK